MTGSSTAYAALQQRIGRFADVMHAVDGLPMHGIAGQ